MSKKIFIFFFTLFSILFYPAYSQNDSKLLEKADNLFDKQNYEQALSIYEQILNKSDKFSLPMLLKMAFINEYNEDYTSALYYLNLYYKYHPDKRVLKKMEDLAIEYKLSGYRFTDLEYFISLYNQYYYYISFFFLFSAFTYFIYLIVKKSQKKKLGFRPVIFITILAFSYLFANYDIIPPKGIIKKSGTWLMADASAASSPITQIDKGHRVIILSKDDIWYRILWENRSAYVLESNLMPVGEEKGYSLF